MRKLYLLLAFLAVSAGCTREETDLPEAEPATETVKVVFRVSDVRPATRSGVFDKVSDISELYVWAYDCASGILDCSAKFSGPSLLDNTASMDLKLGHRYSFFALANIRPEAVPKTFRDALAYRFSINSYDEFKGYSPMSALIRDVLIDSEKDILFEMTRLLSQFVVVLHKDNLSGSFDAESVRIRQAAADICPFSGSSMATRVIDGDFASTGELASLGSGRPVTLYMLENARGILARGNTDPWSKIPIRESQESLCTYLEISGRYTSPLFNTDNLTLRMYLGQNNTDNFDVLRNEVVALHVYLSDTGAAEGIFDNYWRVDPGDYEVVGSLIFSRNYAMCAKCADGSLMFDRRGRRVYSLSDTVSIKRPYPTVEYELSCDRTKMADAGLEYSVGEDGLLLSSNTSSPRSGCAGMLLESTNEQLHDSLTVLTRPVRMDIRFNPVTRRLESSLPDGCPVALKLNFETDVVLDIQCICHKDGTMFDPQVCDYQLKCTKRKDLVMGRTFQAFDEGAVDSQMRIGYSTTQWDSYNLIGHANIYYHNYHPVKCRISIKCTVVEPAALAGRMVLTLNSSYFKDIGDAYTNDVDGWYCLYGDPTLMYFYHPQDNVTYGFTVQELFNGFEFNDDTYHASSISVAI